MDPDPIRMILGSGSALVKNAGSGSALQLNFRSFQVSKWRRGEPEKLIMEVWRL
jgi:hypothetical protein